MTVHYYWLLNPWLKDSQLQMKAHLQLLGAGSLECGSHSLYYFLDQYRMLFNVSEGVQRLACQYRLKVSPNRLSAIILTRLDWECFGGLPGLILTMGDTARLLNDEVCRPLRIIGPRGLAHAIAAMRPFLHRRDFAVDVTEVCTGDDSSSCDDGISHWRDEQADIDVWFLQLHSKKEKSHSSTTAYRSSTDTSTTAARSSTSTDTTAAADLNVANVDCREESPNHFLMKMFQSEYSVKFSQTEREERCQEYAGRLSRELTCDGHRSLAVLLQGPTQPGKFDRAAALAKGIKPGPLFGRLASGESVTLASGEVVHPSACVGPRRPSPAVLILDLPTWELAQEAFRNVESLAALMSRAQAPGVQSVMHLLGAEVLMSQQQQQQPQQQDERRRAYLDFCQQLSQLQQKEGAGTPKHLFTAPNYSILMTSSVGLQRTLGTALSSPFFPSGQQAPHFLSADSVSGDDFAAIVAKPLDRIHLSPEGGFEHERVIDWDAYEETLAAAEGEDTAAHFDKDEIYVSTLGTGSAIPGKYRNVSSTLIENNPNNEAIFLDCGEMSLGQVYRLFGSAKAPQILANTSAILISHKHGDHHLGALSLIKAIGKCKREGRLLLVAPRRFHVWLEEFAQVSDFGFDGIDFLPADLILEEPVEVSGTGTQIRAFEVDHCLDAFGFQVTFASGKRVVYSGDTRPCDSLIAAAHECDLLVNEATMSDELLHEAIIRKHCTISEAVDIAFRAKAKRTVLTHFSQRYAKGALSVDQSVYSAVAMGVDLLRFPLGKFDEISAYTPLLPTLLPIDEEGSNE